MLIYVCYFQVIQRLHRFGLCLSPVATRKAVDVIRQDFDKEMLDIREKLQVFNRGFKYAFPFINIF